MTALDLLLITSATLYINEVVTTKAGPGDVFIKFRKRVPLGGMTSCPWCFVPYVAGLVVLAYLLLPTPLQPILWIFGVAGLVMIVRSYSGVQHGG